MLLWMTCTMLYNMYINNVPITHKMNVCVPRELHALAFCSVISEEDLAKSRCLIDLWFFITTYRDNLNRSCIRCLVSNSTFGKIAPDIYLISLFYIYMFTPKDIQSYF